MWYQFISFISFSVIAHEIFIFLYFGPVWWSPWAPPWPLCYIHGNISSIHILAYDFWVPPDSTSIHIFYLISCDRSWFFYILVFLSPVWWFQWAPPWPLFYIHGRILSLYILVGILGFYPVSYHTLSIFAISITKQGFSVFYCFGYFCSIWYAPWATPQPLYQVHGSIGLFAYFGCICLI